ncbi:hypothetical protein F8M41_003474 [Gigaspora margarita]|uniref:Uncharacterized protein n=1 Tax=Gigaspora margarita TaxID=4874 RepID=A0A8H4A8G0_GIGMA|nr:hypothetical protein F8M41_003474 [Gigaspora margarita]
MPIIKPRRKSNEYRIVEIDTTLFLEVKIKENIFFLTDLKHFNLIKNHTWYCNKNKNDNTFYIKTNISPFSFHQKIYSEWKIIDYINRNGLDNHEINLRDGLKINQLNRKLHKNNTFGYNGITFLKVSDYRY